MARLVAVQHADPTRMLAALDEVWAAGDAALPLDAAAPAEHTADLLGDGTPVPDGTALVVATSGSTGAPRGIVLSHDALATATRASRDRLGAGDGVPWLGVLPLHHVAGISVVLRSRAAGCEPLLHTRDDPAVIEAAPRSWISLVPTQLRRLLDAGVDLARHAGILLGGAAVDAELLATAAARDVRVVTSYGATETAGGCVYDGRPLDGVEVRTTDDGLVQLRTPTVATGVRRPDGGIDPVVDHDGWWTSADRGRIEDGRLVVLGRADDVVVSGGENVPLAPVRRALAALDGVAASAVVGLPDERWGTAVTAVVVPTGAPPTLADVRAALAPALARHHLPTLLVVAEELPTSGLGKVTPVAVRSAVRNGPARLVR